MEYPTPATFYETGAPATAAASSPPHPHPSHPSPPNPPPDPERTATPRYYLDEQQTQQQQQQQHEQQQQQYEQPLAPPYFVEADLQSLRTSCEASLREYAALRRQNGVVATDSRLRAQGSLAASDLRALRAEVAVLVRKSESGRWRTWLFGGLLASIVPVVRRFFRRSPTDDRRAVATNDTEHAFRKSKTLVGRILESAHARGRSKSALASVACVVLAVLYVFQGEVSLRVARTVAKRLKRLVAKVEVGLEDVEESDLKVLSGWRWRVLLW